MMARFLNQHDDGVGTEDVALVVVVLCVVRAQLATNSCSGVVWCCAVPEEW